MEKKHPFFILNLPTIYLLSSHYLSTFTPKKIWSSGHVTIVTGAHDHCHLSQ